VHAVVLVGIEGEHVTCVDPALDHALIFDLSSFLKVWSNPGHLGLVVWV
jgi:predicted double-glycine peptidase